MLASDMDNFIPHSNATVSPAALVSYAQNGEDIMLWRALRTVERGCYIDVGAAEPMADSVTCAFYRRGWRGVNIEPTPTAFERLRAARPEDLNLNLAVGDREGTIPFFLVDGGNGLSTASEPQAETFREQGWIVAETSVPVRSLAAIVAEYLPDQPIHFLKVDAEGSERAVLAGADLRRFRPWIVLVEATAPNSQEPTHQEWEDLLTEADYRFVWFDGLNRFYLAAEHDGFASCFRVQPNVFDGFIHHSEAEAREVGAALEAQRGQVQALQAELAVAREQTPGLEAALEAERAQAQALQTELAVARERTSGLEAALDAERAQAQALRAELTAELTIARERMRTLESTLEAERTQAQALQADLAHTASERDSWAQELYESNRHAAHLAQVRQGQADEINVRKAELHARDAEVARLQQQVHAVYASTSWRVSWPVRTAARVFGRRP